MDWASCGTINQPRADNISLRSSRIMRSEHSAVIYFMSMSNSVLLAKYALEVHVTMGGGVRDSTDIFNIGILVSPAA